MTDLQTTEARLIATAVDGYQEDSRGSSRGKGRLTDDISHELRTPTSVIATASELLLDDPTVVGVARERVERIARAGRRTGAVVEALLFLGRDDSLGAPVIVDLRTVVNDTVEVYLPLARDKGLDLQVECSGEQLITAPPGNGGDRAAEPDRECNSLHGTRQRACLLEPGRLAVEDTGVGLAGVDRNRIFERGYRSDASSWLRIWTRSDPARVQRVGWQVSAHERPTGGTRFEVAFSRAYDDMTRRPIGNLTYR